MISVRHSQAISVHGLQQMSVGSRWSEASQLTDEKLQKNYNRRAFYLSRFSIHLINRTHRLFFWTSLGIQPFYTESKTPTLDRYNLV